MLTHIVDGRVVVNLLQVDTVDSWTFLDLFLEELQRVVLWQDKSQTRYSRSCHAMPPDKKKQYKANYTTTNANYMCSLFLKISQSNRFHMFSR